MLDGLSGRIGWLAKAPGAKVSHAPRRHRGSNLPAPALARSTMSSAIASSGPTCGRCAKDCAAPTPTNCSTAYCQRLVIDGTQLWRAHVAMETLHPQWNGYGYTWRRDLNAIEPEQYAHGSLEEDDWLSSPFNHLIERARDGRGKPNDAPAAGNRPRPARFPDSGRIFRRRRDRLPRLSLRLRKRTATARREPASSIRSRPTAEAASATTIRGCLQATLPALSLAMKSHAGSRHRLGAAGDLSRRGRRTARPRRLDHARFGRQAARRDLVRRHPRLHPDQRLGAGSRRRRIAQ